MDDQARIEFMREAVRIAAENVDHGGGPFGAVVVRDGRIIARGRNRVTELGDPTAHAEVEAIREACRALGSFQLEGCEIYCSSEPCPMCLGAVYWSRPDALYFATSHDEAAAVGFDDSFIYEEMGKPLEERSLHTRVLDVEGSREAHRRWLENEGRVEY
jgi:guanine deaminase